jgi:predicted ATP-grasp superfamily ATP-dependent carboligase
MKTLVRSIEGISTWQYFVNNDDMPGTTEHPTNAVMPAASASEDS